MTTPPNGKPPRKHNPAWADNTRAERQKRYRARLAESVSKVLSVRLPPARLVTPLPCSIRKDTPTGLCLEPAYVAYVEMYADDLIPGRYILQPICEDCAKAAAANYSIDKEKNEHSNMG